MTTRARRSIASADAVRPRPVAAGRRRSRGQALVELAIVLPVFLVLVLAAVDLGRIFFARITIANSAREGAYEASYGGSYAANAACSNSNTVMCAVLNEAQGSLTVTPADVAWACNPADGCGSGAYGDAVTVTVTGHFDLLTPILAVFFGGTNVTFSSTATADVIDTTSAGMGFFTPAPSDPADPSDDPTDPSDDPTDPSDDPGGPSSPPAPSVSPIPTAPTCPVPIANFTWTQQNKNRPVEFTSTSTPTTGTCQITFWRWEFGDGDTDAGALPNVGHDYLNADGTRCQGCTFSVTLTVTNPFGSVSRIATVTTRS
jgi:Flp pilus assembly protein TadG